MEQHLSTIWNVLWEYRDNPDVRMEAISDGQWDDITYAMSKLHEALDVPHDNID